MSLGNAPRAKKRFGQNFLHDQNVISHIVKAIAPKPGQRLVEIGPGLGALSAPVLEACGELHVVELDQDVIPHLLQACDGKGTLTIHQADALKFNFSQLIEDEHGDSAPLRVIGNLPYNISSPLLFHLLEQEAEIADMHFMLQQEVVQRMAASPGNKQYGRLTVMLNYYCQIEPLFTVKPGSFTPAPKVMSAIVRLIPHPQRPHQAADENLLSTVVTQAFGQRRKTLTNSLRTLISAEQLQHIDINPSLRPEMLACEQFVRIANHLHHR